MKVTFLGAILLLMACSSAPVPVRLIVEENANQTSAIAIDLIAVLDPAIAAQLTELSGAEWFENKQAYLFQYGDRLILNSLELVPGLRVSPAAWPNAKSSDVQYLVAAHFLIRPELLSVDAYNIRTITVKQHELELTYRK